VTSQQESGEQISVAAVETRNVQNCSLFGSSVSVMFTLWVPCGFVIQNPWCQMLIWRYRQFGHAVSKMLLALHYFFNYSKPHTSSSVAQEHTSLLSTQNTLVPQLHKYTL